MPGFLRKMHIQEYTIYIELPFSPCPDMKTCYQLLYNNLSSNAKHRKLRDNYSQYMYMQIQTQSVVTNLYVQLNVHVHTACICVHVRFIYFSLLLLLFTRIYTVLNLSMTLQSNNHHIPLIMQTTVITHTYHRSIIIMQHSTQIQFLVQCISIIVCTQNIYMNIRALYN